MPLAPLFVVYDTYERPVGNIVLIRQSDNDEDVSARSIGCQSTAKNNKSSLLLRRHYWRRDIGPKAASCFHNHKTNFDSDVNVTPVSDGLTQLSL
jgi:hypothetical protein